MGLKTPQGVAYLAATDTIYVASAGDGLVRRFKADDFAETAPIDLGDDADNIRIDGATNEVVVGYGAGGLAVLESASGQKGAAPSAPSAGKTRSQSGGVNKTPPRRPPHGTNPRVPFPPPPPQL